MRIQDFNKRRGTNKIAEHFIPNMLYRVSTRTGKPGEMERHFSVREKNQGILNRREKSGKITENTGKIKKIQRNVIYYFSDI